MIVTLLSDFGLSDSYVAVMKGVIATVNPQIQVIDLTHQIAPQDIAMGRFQLMNAYAYFPPGTVHVAVVDPGVGSQRRSIAVQLASGFLVGPDNGLFSGVLSQNSAIAAVELTNQNVWRTPQPSSTFHGRDVFAPVGAYLAMGVPIDYLGNAIGLNSLVQFSLPEAVETEFGLQGSIQAVDRFGNLITNIPANAVQGQIWSVRVDDDSYWGKTTYADASPGEVIALVGSHGWIEVAANRGNAQEKLGLSVGSSISVVWESPSNGKISRS
jgi:S-adenosyl-L-methionine hydrolase (adenosine-forming)